MYISKLRIKNWRNFTKAEVDLREIVYLIGPNASGKSNFLDIFRFMRDLVNPSGGAATGRFIPGRADQDQESGRPTIFAGRVGHGTA